MKQNIRQLGIWVLGALALAGCRAGIPREVHQAADKVPDRIKTARSRIAAERKSYQGYTSTEDYQRYAKYAEREKWLEFFDQANATLKEAEQYLDKQIQPLLDKNEKTQTATVQSRLAVVNKIIQGGEQMAWKATQRKQFLADTMANAPAMVSKAQTQMEDLMGGVANLIAPIRGAQKKHPHKKADLDKRLATAESLRDKAEKGLREAQAELKKPEKDWAMLGDGAAAVGQRLTDFKFHDRDVRARVDQLDRSYTKQLIDMRADYMVTIGRSDWDDYSESETEQVYIYEPVTVSPTQFEWYDKQDEDEISEQSVINIGLDPHQSISYTSKTFWVENTYTAFFHKYKVEENGRVTQTDWLPVDEAYFDTNEDNLGMELVSKPKGMYEDEAIKVASPPGMAYVGNPHYGHWRHHGGSSFWVWYGGYRLLGDSLGWNRNRYDRGEHDNWRRNFAGRKPYYGPQNQEDRYGSYSSGTRSLYSGSHWAQSGGFRWQDSSVRGAGSSYRGGGPGGGGK